MKRNVAGIVALIAVVLAVIVIVKYNALVGRQEAVEKAWAPLAMKLKERYAPVPMLITDVTAYVGRKPEFARNLEANLDKAVDIKSISDAVRFANQVETDLTRLIQWLKERYPGIINRHSVREISRIMRETEAALGAEMRMFNNSAERYNSYARRFPNNAVALLLFFPVSYEYFQPKGG